jgi:GNAT superfamily N-acetyltransferase
MQRPHIIRLHRGIRRRARAWHNTGGGVGRSEQKMTHEPGGLIAGLHLTFDPDPSVETRRTLGAAINAFHAQTLPFSAERFALLLRDDAAVVAAGLSGTLSWGWLFVEALWVSDELRGRGIGRALMAGAEDFARAKDCHSAWLDTFQASGFYARLGYESFGVLEDYPPGQSRHFLRKRLGGRA